jgi:hypothetical protein
VVESLAGCVYVLDICTYCLCAACCVACSRKLASLYILGAKIISTALAGILGAISTLREGFNMFEAKIVSVCMTYARWCTDSVGIPARFARGSVLLPSLLFQPTVFHGSTIIRRFPCAGQLAQEDSRGHEGPRYRCKPGMQCFRHHNAGQSSCKGFNRSLHVHRSMHAISMSTKHLQNLSAIDCRPWTRPTCRLYR